MARDFDGTNDNVDFGSDASIDQMLTWSISFWVVKDVTNASYFVCSKYNDASVLGWVIYLLNNAGGNRLRFRSFWTTTGTWVGTTGINAGQIRHIAVVYDGGATSNDATLYVDGAQETLTTDTNPTGTITTDAAQALRLGESADGVGDTDGRISHLNVAAALWTAAQVNRAKWWGTPGGAIAVCHPLVTDKLTNNGTATANGTATGTTMSSIPRVERCWGATMGVGR